jgi:two-component system response regulator HydG
MSSTRKKSMRNLVLCKKTGRKSVVFYKSQPHTEKLIGNTPQMRELLFMIDCLSKHNMPILINGETGTGKELVAKILHNKSSRRSKPFVYTTCASSQSITQKESFCNEKESFNGVAGDRQGKFVLADKGTLFLDEISEICPDTQENLFKFLKYKVINRNGSKKPIHLDVRIIASNSRNLSKAVASGTLKKDLYHLLKNVQLEIPPLRHRRGDIPLIVEYFLKKIYWEMGIKPKIISPDALDLLMGYDWPGNIRELRNIIEKALILGKGNILYPRDFPEYIKNGKHFMTLREMERQHIIAALKKAGGNKSEAASLLDITQTTLYNKIKHLSSF